MDLRIEKEEVLSDLLLGRLVYGVA